MTSFLELVGVTVVVGVVVGVFGWVYGELTFSAQRRRARARRHLEDRMRRLSICDVCGARGCAHFIDPGAEVLVALRAFGRYLDRVRADRRRRVS